MLCAVDIITAHYNFNLIFTLTLITMETTWTLTSVGKVSINTGGTTVTWVICAFVTIKNCQQIIMLNIKLNLLSKKLLKTKISKFIFHASESYVKLKFHIITYHASMKRSAC